MKTTQFTKWLLFGLLTAQFCISSGCHRGYYRRQADNEARQLVGEKTADPRWNYADGAIDIDPQSRMFDPFSQDHPPIPPDDAASHQLMHEVDCKQGYPHWHANGDTNYVENPDWRSFLPMNEKGQVVLDLETAFRMAQLHSTDFQAQRETLYLTALDVSLDRFGFDTQMFSGFNHFFNIQGSRSPGGDSTTLSSSLGSNGQGINLQRLGVTGANFAVGLANSILWNFNGPNTQTATSLIDFSVIQPLLRNAGRDRIMESLTQAERALLANVRQLDRFRRGFYLQITTGRNPGAGPNRSGNFLFSPGSPSANAGGYLGLLQQQQNIRIQEFNVRQLETVLDQFNEFYRRERLEALQVFQFENTFYSAQNTLLRQKTNYQNSLDNFKQLIGLPPELDVVIQDPFLSQFEFISDNINRRQIEIYGLKTLTGETVIAAGDRINVEAGTVPPNIDDLMAGIQDNIGQAISMVNDVETIDVQEIEGDIENLRAARPRRIAYFQKLRQNIKNFELLSDIDPNLFSADSIADPQDLVDGLTNAITNLNNVKQSLENIRLRIEDIPNQRQALNAQEFARYLTQILEEVPESLSVFSGVLVEFSLLQAQSRSDAIELNDVSLTDDQALAIARCFRRDWMNARASLVDQWRQIEFAADQLESQLDLVFEGDIGNVGDNPLRLRFDTGQLRAGVRFDAPIVRLSERNNYRETLINYQQSKRAFYQFRDDIHSSLRQTLRVLNLNRALFEVNRKSVQAAIKQVDNAQLRLIQPVGPNQSARLGATTARDLTGAINSLQIAQTTFLDTWVQYEVARRNLDFDMGTFQLDENGRWLDPGEIDSTIAVRAAMMMGIELDCQFCDDQTMFNSPFVDDPNGLDFEPPSSLAPPNPANSNGIPAPTPARRQPLNQPSTDFVPPTQDQPKTELPDIPAPTPAGSRPKDATPPAKSDGTLPELKPAQQPPDDDPTPIDLDPPGNPDDGQTQGEFLIEDVQQQIQDSEFESQEAEIQESADLDEKPKANSILEPIETDPAMNLNSDLGEGEGTNDSESESAAQKDYPVPPELIDLSHNQSAPKSAIYRQTAHGMFGNSQQSDSGKNNPVSTAFQFRSLPGSQARFPVQRASQDVPLVAEAPSKEGVSADSLRPISNSISNLQWNSGSRIQSPESGGARVVSPDLNPPASNSSLLTPLDSSKHSELPKANETKKISPNNPLR